MRTMQTDIADIRDGQVTGNAGIGFPTDAPAASELSATGMLGVLRGVWVELRGIGERLAMLSRTMARPAWFDVASGGLRIGAGTLPTVTTVTTVTTLTNQSQIGGVDAKTAYSDIIMRDAWCNSVRQKVI